MSAIGCFVVGSSFGLLGSGLSRIVVCLIDLFFKRRVTRLGMPSW